MTQQQTETEQMVLARDKQAAMTLVRSTTDVQSVLKAVGEAKRAGFNVLTSATLTETLPLDHQLSIRMVASRGERDFFSTGRDKFAPSGKMLDKIAQAGGLRWRVDLIRRLDDRRDPYYCIYEAVGVAPDPATGEPRMMKGTKAIDLRDGSPLCEEMLENARASKYNKTEEDAQVAAKKAIRQKRKFINELTETGARLRVIRALFSIDSDFTAEEIKKDFVIVSLDHLVHRSEDPEVLAKHREENRKLRDAMYYGIGGPNGKALPMETLELPDEPLETRPTLEAQVVPQRVPTEEAPEIPFDEDDIPFGPDDVPF